jgi:hypothetical protein
MRPRLRKPIRRLSTIALMLALTMANIALAQDNAGSNKQPLAFGPGQVIIDLNKLVWEPLQPEGWPGNCCAARRRQRRGTRSRGTIAGKLYVSKSQPL